jgi:hypothetical protein
LDYILTSLSTALGMIIHLNREVLNAVGTSLYTSLTAIVLATVSGVPCGAAVGLLRFPGRRAALTLLNTLGRWDVVKLLISIRAGCANGKLIVLIHSLKLEKMVAEVKHHQATDKQSDGLPLGTPKPERPFHASGRAFLHFTAHRLIFQIACYTALLEAHVAFNLQQRSLSACP